MLLPYCLYAFASEQIHSSIYSADSAVASLVRRFVFSKEFLKCMTASLKLPYLENIFPR